MNNGTGDGGNQSGAKLIIEFEPRPNELPDDIGGPMKVTLDSGTIVLRDVRAIGDAAPGDERTTIDEVTIVMGDGIVRSELPMAPAGVYSLVRGQLVTYQFKGECEIGGEEMEFDVEDSPGSLSMAVPLTGVELSDDDETIRIRIDVSRILRELDWTKGDMNDDTVEIDEEFDEIDDLRASLLSEFMQN